MHVLLVDDTEAIRYSVSQLLKFEEIECDTAANVEEALEQMEQHATRGTGFDVILLDLMMPGLPVEHLIRTARQTTRTPIVIFSAAMEAQPEALTIGADGCLSKPFEFQALLDELKRVSSLREVARPTQAYPQRSGSRGCPPVGLHALSASTPA